MTRPVAPLAGPDAAVFGLLQKVVAIGRHRRAWQPRDVVRVAVEHLPSAYPRALRDAQTRAERAEATARRLRQQLTEAQAVPAEHHTAPRCVRVAVLSPLQAAIFEEHRRGKPHKWIAADRGMKPSSVTNLVARAVERLGADNPLHAARLVTEGLVEIRIQSRRSRAA